MAVCSIITRRMSRIASSFVHSRSALSSFNFLCVRTLATTSCQKTSAHNDQGDNTKQQENTHEKQAPGTSQSKNDEHEYEHLIRQRILQASIPHVQEYGWTKKAIEAGARDEGLPPVAHGMFPRGGAELVHFFNVKSNLELAKTLKLEVENAKSQGVRKLETIPFIRDALKTRLKMIVPYRNTWPQAMAILALPQNLPESFSNLLKLTDDIWFYAEDRSVDFNWYTKRLSLAAVYAATETYMIQDKSPDLQDTWTFLDNRLENVQRFAAAKRSCGQTRDFLKEASVGFFIMGRNILGLNSRNN
uniref:Ubiquinone biosynthesis protein n=1 Tax=Arion vulgaris TaxID=1028688 RepID=A0A0B7A0T7_9EUPU